MIKISRINLLIIVIALLLSCQNDRELVKDHFNSKEEVYIHEMVEYFKNSICSNEFSDNCLKNYLESIRDSFNINSPINTKLNGKHLEKLCDNYRNNLPNNIIYNKCDIENPEKNKNTTYYCIKSWGKYINFLKDLGKNNYSIELYAGSIELLGDVGPNLTSHIIYNFEKYEFHKPDNLIMLAVHYSQFEMLREAKQRLEGTTK